MRTDWVGTLRRANGTLRALGLPLMLLWWSCGAGCVSQSVSEPIRPRVKTTLIVTRAGEDVTLRWESEPDEIYTILYTDRGEPDAHWAPLPGRVNMPGTGSAMQVKDRVPLHIHRNYKLHSIARSP